jgi:hypothetical protein
VTVFAAAAPDPLEPHAAAPSSLTPPLHPPFRLARLPAGRRPGRRDRLPAGRPGRAAVADEPDDDPAIPRRRRSRRQPRGHPPPRGTVDYGRVDAGTGQRSGIRATITPAMVAAAAEDELGSTADSGIRPPGFDRLPARNRARAHLLGRQLGGTGELAANLVALYQTRANSPVMRDYETAVAEAVQAGETVRYAVRPLYPSRTSKEAPSAIRITAGGDRGFRLDVTVANTPEAAVKEAVVP